MVRYLLVFNCGSSSLNGRLYRVLPNQEPHLAYATKAFHVGTRTQAESYINHRLENTIERVTIPLQDPVAAAGAMLDYLAEHGLAVDMVGQRFVHGGARFSRTNWVTREVLPELDACALFAPIHNPNTLSVIRLCFERMPAVPQYATFDTAFHAGMPEAAWRYAIPYDLAVQHDYRKYGFHGLSYQHVTRETSRYLGIPLPELRLVACHLGTGGSSAAAIHGGRSLDTTMGYSPLPGLVMSTRSGDLDPAIVLDLIERHGLSPSRVNQMLNKESGLVGLSGSTSDLFELLALAEAGDSRARLAVDVYCHRLKSAIGAMLAVLGGADALVFTDDIGAHAWQVREQACAGLDWLGIRIDQQRNRSASPEQVSRVSSDETRIQVLVVPADEEAVIAREGLDLLNRGEVDPDNANYEEASD